MELNNNELHPLKLETRQLCMFGLILGYSFMIRQQQHLQPSRVTSVMASIFP